MLKKDMIKIINTDQDIDDEIELGNKICKLTVGVDDFYSGLRNHLQTVEMPVTYLSEEEFQKLFDFLFDNHGETTVGVPIIDMVEEEFQKVVDFIYNEANKREEKTVSFTIQTNKK